MTALLRKPTTWLITVAGLAVVAFCVLVVPNYRIFVIHTGSMTPTIPIGSAVIVEKGPVHVGEVITFHRLGDGDLVTHRLVAMLPNGTLQTKGDGNKDPDLGSIPRSNVVGHVVAAPQHAGAWLNFMFHTPLGYGFDGLIVLILVGALSNSKPKAKKSTSHRATKHRSGPSTLPGAPRAQGESAATGDDEADDLAGLLSGR